MALHNGAAHLTDQLESLARQTHGDWSLRISDDGSSDDGPAICERFAATMPGYDIRLTHGPGRGAARNFLSLLQTCDPRAEYAAFCDQDDVWRPEKLTHALTHLSRVPAGRPALYCGRTIVTDDRLNIRGHSPDFWHPPGFSNALVQSIAGGNTMVLNRAALDLMRVAARYDGPVPAHDWWCYQVITGAGGQVIFDTNPQVFYRQHGRNLVGSNLGVPARLSRLHRLCNGTYRSWTDQNLTALQAISPLLTDAALETLATFRAVRDASFVRKGRLLRKTGVYRQTRAGHLALWAAALTNRL
ncbi:MAG: glycosyltransferase [Alphaproteobacteria bacterium]|nr:glycosyltransferase [Alphaproteobacteria bacterium]